MNGRIVSGKDLSTNILKDLANYVEYQVNNNCDCILNKSKLLHVLHKDDDDWRICNDSKFKININMNSIDSFDDGEIV